jgi:hypothetical protein
MDLYLNDNKKQKVILNDVVYNLILYTQPLIGDRLISSDNYILQDKYGVYLMS